MLKTLLIGGLLSVFVATGIASAATAGVTEDNEKGPHMYGPRQHFAKEVDHEKVDIENGIVLTITTENSEILAKMQARAQEEHEGRGPFGDSVTREVEILENGIQVTLTSNDPEIVEKLQVGPPRGGNGHMKPKFRPMPQMAE